MGNDREKRKDLLIIIPAHNEEANLPGVFDRLREYKVTEYADILIIDDASSDRTHEIAEENGAEVLSFVFNLGYGNALQGGYKFAVFNGYKYLIQMDADGQHDPSNISAIYDELKGVNGEKADLVLASRFMKGSGEYKTGFIMKLGFKWFETIVKILSGVKIVDATTGFQGLSYKAFGYYAGFDHFDAKFPDSNMTLRMILLGYNVKQIPATMHTRSSGKGMHSGFIKPVSYMVRSTVAVLTVWMRHRIFEHKK